MISFHLITGFLGSGKTTLLKNLLNQIGGKERIAVIQNEFSPSGIDGKELIHESPEFKLVEINNGSVFCVCQLDNFISTLRKLINDYKPDRIFLEASGLSDPISVAELIQSSDLSHGIILGKIICMVDSPNFLRVTGFLTQTRHQIMVADLILMNRVDLFEGYRCEIVREVEKLNPFAEILPSIYAQPEGNQDLLPYLKNDGIAAKQFSGLNSLGRPDIKCAVLRSHLTIHPRNLEAFIKDILPDCIRMKGFVNLNDGSVLLLSSVYEKYETRKIDGFSGPTEIIAFAYGLQPGTLRKKFRYYSERAYKD